MIINGATIYNEGASIGHDCEEKIRQIMNTLKTLSPSSSVSMRFLRTGRQYEALVWGRADDLPIGVYNRGASLGHVLDIIHAKVKKQCIKSLKINRGCRATTFTDASPAMAG